MYNFRSLDTAWNLISDVIDDYEDCCSASLLVIFALKLSKFFLEFVIYDFEKKGF